MDRSQLFGRSGMRALIAYLAIWGVAVAYLALSGGDWTFPIVSLGIFGLILGALIWLLTRRMDAPPVPVEEPKKQSIGLLIYLAIYAVLFIGVGIGLSSSMPFRPAAARNSSLSATNC